MNALNHVNIFKIGVKKLDVSHLEGKYFNGLNLILYILFQLIKLIHTKVLFFFIFFKHFNKRIIQIK